MVLMVLTHLLSRVGPNLPVPGAYALVLTGMAALQAGQAMAAQGNTMRYTPLLNRCRTFLSQHLGPVFVDQVSQLRPTAKDLFELTAALKTLGYDTRALEEKLLVRLVDNDSDMRVHISMINDMTEALAMSQRERHS